MKKLSSPILILFLLLSSPLYALDQEDLLQVDDAFSPEIVLVNNDNFTLRFSIAEKYYLYKHAFKFPNDKQAVCLLYTSTLPTICSV